MVYNGKLHLGFIFQWSFTIAYSSYLQMTCNYDKSIDKYVKDTFLFHWWPVAVLLAYANSQSAQNFITLAAVHIDTIL